MAYDFEYRQVKVGEKRTLDDGRIVSCTGGSAHNLDVTVLDSSGKVLEKWSGVHEVTFLNFGFNAPAVVGSGARRTDDGRGSWSERTNFCTLRRLWRISKEEFSTAFIDKETVMVGGLLFLVDGNRLDDGVRYGRYGGYSKSEFVTDMKVLDTLNVESYKGVGFTYTDKDGVCGSISILHVFDKTVNGEKEQFVVYCYNRDTVLCCSASRFEKNLSMGEVPVKDSYFVRVVGDDMLYSVAYHKSNGKFTVIDNEGYLYVKYTFDQIKDLLPEDIKALRLSCENYPEGHIVPSLYKWTSRFLSTLNVYKCKDGSWNIKDVTEYPSTKYLGYMELYNSRVNASGAYDVTQETIKKHVKAKKSTETTEVVGKPDEEFVKPAEKLEKPTEEVVKPIEATSPADEVLKSAKETTKPVEKVTKPEVESEQPTETAPVKSKSGKSDNTVVKGVSDNSSLNIRGFKLGGLYTSEEYGLVMLVGIKGLGTTGVAYQIENGKATHTLNYVELEGLRAV